MTQVARPEPERSRREIKEMEEKREARRDRGDRGDRRFFPSTAVQMPTCSAMKQVTSGASPFVYAVSECSACRVDLPGGASNTCQEPLPTPTTISSLCFLDLSLPFIANGGKLRSIQQWRCSRGRLAVEEAEGGGRTDPPSEISAESSHTRPSAAEEKAVKKVKERQ